MKAVDHPTRRWLVDIVATLAGSALVVSAAMRLQGSWRATDDLAAIAFRSRDTFRSHVPLVGMPSTAGEGVSHPGPLELWINGFFDAVLGGHSAVMLGTVAMSLAAIAVVIACGRVLGGEVGASLAAFAALLLGWSLYGPVLVSPLNPHAGLFPLGAALAAAVVTAVEPRPWSLPVCVAFATYAAQAHVVLAMILVVTLGPPAVAGLLTARRRTAGLRRLLPTLGLVVLLWMGPIIDVVVHDGGNVRAVVRALGANGDGPTEGVWRAATIVAGTIGPVPVFADRGVSGAVIHEGAGTALTLLVWILLGGLGVLAYLGRRTAPALAWASGLVLGVAVGSLVVTARIPSETLNGLSLYNYLALWIVSLGVWGVGAALVVRALRSRLAGAGPSLSPRVAVGSVVLVAAVAVGAVVVLPVPQPTPEMQIVRQLGAQLAAVLPDDRPYLVELRLDLSLYAIDAGVASSLDVAGYDVRVPEYFAPGFGAHRAGPSASTERLRVVVGPTGPLAGEVVATFRPPTDVTRVRDRAVEDLVDVILEDAGVLGVFADRVDDRASTEEFVRGQFAALAASGLFRDGLSERASTQVLIGQIGLPRETVRVVRIAADAPDLSAGGG